MSKNVKGLLFMKAKPGEVLKKVNFFFQDHN